MAGVANNTPLIGIQAVALDTETTGLDPKTARIVQIGAIVIGGARDEADRVAQGASFDRLVNPGEPIAPRSSEIHGLIDADVAGAPDFAAVAPDLDRFCEGRVVVGHNISFDMAILLAENARIGRAWSSPQTLDTLLLARIAFPDQVDLSLEALAARLGVAVAGRHTALGDAVVTAELFTALLPHLQARGVRSFGEADRRCQEIAEAMILRQEAGVFPSPDRSAQTSPIQPPAAQIDSFPYVHQVEDVMARAPLVVADTTSIMETAKALTDRKTSSAFVDLGPSSAETGIVTERDLMRALASAPEAGRAPVASIASRPLITVTEDSFVYRAIALMDRHRIRHLGVVDEAGRLVGALTTGDLLRQRAQAALVMGDEIDHARDVSELAQVWSRLPIIAQSMLAEAVPTDRITAVISDELAALTRRAGELALAHMRHSGRGDPPSPYCLLILGSAGRRESRLSPDQDNALIYKNDDDAQTDAWFADYATFVSGLLDQAGVPYCKGGVMATNPAWRHSLEGWKRVVGGWIDGFEDTNLMSVDIFYDFRAVLGDAALADALWSFAHERARASRGFLKSLAALTTDVRPAVGLFGRLRTEDGRVDAKKNGLFAIVGAARTLAVRHGFALHSTTERLRAVRGEDGISAGEIDDMIDAHEVLSREILRQQLIDIEAGRATSTRVELARLTRREREELGWALGRVESAKMLVGGPGGMG